MPNRRALLLVATAAVAIIAVACGSASSNGPDDGTAPNDATAEPLSPTELAQRFGSSWSNTDFSKSTLDFSEVLSGGPGKDGIPAIDNPQFVSIAEADDFLAGQEPVLALEVNGDARAYPIQILIWHEITNDTVGGVPVTVTFCPLCNSAIVFEREFGGVVYDFGVSGLLFRSNLVMYDRQTESWWEQFVGEAVVGELTGTLLELVPASMVSWDDFKATFPDGQVLSRDTGFSRSYGQNPYTGYDTIDGNPFLFRGELDGRLPPVERVAAVELNGETVAYPFTLLEEQIVVSDTIGGEPVVVFFQPGTTTALGGASIPDARDVGATGVFRPEASGRALTFRADGEKIIDNETGSRWNVLGKAVDGELAGEELAQIVSGDHFWFAWAAFQPDTRIFQS